MPFLLHKLDFFVFMCYHPTVIEESIMLNLLESAIRAPSTHNSQPWLFKLEKDKINIFFDPKLLLPFADSATRDMHISIGCLIENLIIAAEFNQIKAVPTYGFFSEKNKIAEVSLTISYQKPSDLIKELYNTIPKRVNARGVFFKEKIPEDLIVSINSLLEESSVEVHFIKDTERINKIASLTADSIKDVYKMKEFRYEMSSWMNSNLSSKKEGLPGYSLKMPLIVSIIIPVLIKYFNIGKFLSKLNKVSISSAPLIVVLSGLDDPISWLCTGRISERIMLYAQSKGYQTSIYVASIEIGGRYKMVQDIIGSKERPQFLFALGHIKGHHRVTPRHSVKDKIIF